MILALRTDSALRAPCRRWPYALCATERGKCCRQEVLELGGRRKHYYSILLHKNTHRPLSPSHTVIPLPPNWGRRVRAPRRCCNLLPAMRHSATRSLAAPHTTGPSNAGRSLREVSQGARLCSAERKAWQCSGWPLWSSKVVRVPPAMWAWGRAKMR